jgi:SAM-dependent methyltransferase
VRSFGRDYVALYAHRNLDEARQNVRDVLALIGPSPEEPLLDLACGAGRHLLALRELGFRDLTGVDLSPELLALAKQNLGSAEPPVESVRAPQLVREARLVRADMRAIPFVGSFATVLSLFTSYGYFAEDDENAAVLAGVYRALRPGGVFLMDYINRPLVLANLTPEDERVQGGRRIHNVRRITPDGRRVEKTTTVTEEDGQVRVFDESVRLYTRDELEVMLRAAGLEDLRACGSLQGEPYAASSPRMVWVARKGAT